MCSHFFCLTVCRELKSLRSNAIENRDVTGNSDKVVQKKNSNMRVPTYNSNKLARIQVHLKCCFDSYIRIKILACFCNT